MWISREDYEKIQKQLSDTRNEIEKLTQRLVEARLLDGYSRRFVGSSGAGTTYELRSVKGINLPLLLKHLNLEQKTIIGEDKTVFEKIK